MPRVQAGKIHLNYVEHGAGDDVVLALHGDLGCADWFSLAMPLFATNVRVIVAEWRGCGDSDKPEPASDYSNYSIATHAVDMLALLDALHVKRCHLFGQATGGIICSRMLVEQPERFRKVLMLDPVTPRGLKLAAAQVEMLSRMKADDEAAFAGLASAAPTLFRGETLVVGRIPQFSAATSRPQRELFRRLVKRAGTLSDGIWFGTPHNLALEWDAQRLAALMPEMSHEHFVLYGSLDYWIPREHIDDMVSGLPNCRLEVFPTVGHSMCVENPLLFARVFNDYFRKCETVRLRRGPTEQGVQR